MRGDVGCARRPWVVVQGGHGSCWEAVGCSAGSCRERGRRTYDVLGLARRPATKGMFDKGRQTDDHTDRVQTNVCWATSPGPLYLVSPHPPLILSLPFRPLPLSRSMSFVFAVLLAASAFSTVSAASSCDIKPRLLTTFNSTLQLGPAAGVPLAVSLTENSTIVAECDPGSRQYSSSAACNLFSNPGRVLVINATVPALDSVTLVDYPVTVLDTNKTALGLVRYLESVKCEWAAT